MFLQENPWPLGTPEHAEWEEINARLLDPRRERRMARYLADQRLEAEGAAPEAPAPELLAVELARLGAAGVLFGPDCSQYQGRPSWVTVAGAGCAIGGYKVSEGATYTDPAHAYNRAAVPQAGLVPLAYHYMSPSSSPAAQADWYCNLVDPHALHALDVEAAKASPGLDVAGWVARYRTHYPTKPLVLYTNHGMWLYRSHVTEPWPAGVEVWHAGIADGRYTGATGSLGAEWAGIAGLSNSMAGLAAGACRLWQFTDHAAVPGVSGTCDGNAFLGTRAELEALATGADDVPLTAAEKQEIITGAGAEAARQVWGFLISSAWDGGKMDAASMLASAQRYAIEGGIAMKRPAGNGSPGTLTYGGGLLAMLTSVAQATDTLEASEAAEAALLSAITPGKLADAIVAKLGGGADAAQVKQAVLDAMREGMPTFNIVPEAAPPQ